MSGTASLNLAVAAVLWAACLLGSPGVSVADTPPEAGPPPPGHLKPMGSHRPPEGSIDAVEGFVDPEEFWEYAKSVGSKPLLFKGAAKGVPAYSLWTDEYLGSKYGKLTVDVEMGKKENRSHGSTQMPLFHFLQKYRKSSIYMVQDVLEEMQGELSLVRPLQCGGFKNGLSSVVIWFSSGGTKSVLHSDGVDNINCLFDGEKTMVMIDKMFGDKVEADGWVAEGAYSQVDVEKVDMFKYPEMQDLPWWEARMEKGDCMFIPYQWYHTVDSSNSRNLAANLWFIHVMWFNKTDCDENKGAIQDYAPLTGYDLGNIFDITPESIRNMLFEELEHKESITIPDMLQIYHDVDPAELQEIFQIIDVDKDLVLTWEEIYSADVFSIVHEYMHLLPDYVQQDIREWEESNGEHDEL